MGAIQVKNVPDELHQQVRERARELGVSVSELLLTLITRELATPSRQEWYARLDQRRPVTDIPWAEVMRENREARDDQVARARSS